MKKGLLAITLGVATIAFGQQPVSSSDLAPAMKKVTVDRNIKSVGETQKTSAIASEWFSYVDNYESFYGTSQAENNFNMLFPDSTVLVNYGSSGYGAPWIHGLAQVFDMNSEIIKSTASTDLMYFNPDKSFDIDSLAFYGFYSRVMGSSVVDTLIIRFHVGGSNDNLNSRYYFQGSGINTNLGADTVFFVAYDWDFNSKMAPGAIETIKIPMNDAFFADSTTGGLHFVDLAANVTIPASSGGLFGVTWDFKPGYSWTPNIDTLGVNINSWRFMSWELNGADTYPFYDKKDNNMSHQMATDVRYNTGTSWDGLYIPAIAYMGSSAGYAYEAHSAYYKVTQDVNVGIGEDNKLESAVFPNPSNGEFNVRLAESGEYTFRLLNIIGQEVYSGVQSVEANQIVPFNFSSLEKGVYLLSIEGNGKSAVQKVTLK